MSSFKRNLPQGRGSFVGENSYTSTNESFVQRAALLPAYGGIGLSMHPMAYCGDFISSGIGASNIRMVLCAPVQSTTLISAMVLYVTSSVANTTINVGIYQIVDNAQKTALDYVLVPGSLASISSASTGQKVFRYSTPVQLEPQYQYSYGVLSLGGNPLMTLAPPTPTGVRPIKVARNQTSSAATSLPTLISTQDSKWTNTLGIGIPVVTFLTKQYEFLL